MRDFRFGFEYGTLALLLAGCVVASLLVSQLFLVRYRATISLPLHGDLQLFHRAEEPLKSIDWFLRYSRGRSQDAAQEAIVYQLSRGDTNLISFEHSFPLSRSDLRELPDSVAQQVVPKILRGGLGQMTRPEAGSKDFEKEFELASDLTVHATDRDMELARRCAAVVMLFVRDTLLRISLSDAIRLWKNDAANELAQVRSEIIAHRSNLESLSRRIQEMQSMRERYKDVALAGTADPSVQVQVNGARFLTPLQQIVALESERIDSSEQLKVLEQTAERLELVSTIGGAFDKILNGEPNATTALDLMDAKLKGERSRLTNPDLQLPASAAFAEIDRVLTSLRSEFVNTASIPPEPTVRREGPGRGLAIAAGLLAGLALWLSLMRLGWRLPGWRLAAKRVDGTP